MFGEAAVVASTNVRCLSCLRSWLTVVVARDWVMEKGSTTSRLNVKEMHLKL